MPSRCARRTLVLAFGLVAGCAAAGRAAETRVGPVIVVNRACLWSTDLTYDYDFLRHEDRCYEEGLRLEARTLAGVGALIERPARAHFLLRLAPMYLPKGLDYVRFDSDDPLRLRIPYIELPVQLKATMGAGSVQFYAVAGPSVGLRLGPASTDLYSSGRLTEYQERRDRWRRFDFGVSGGAGVQLGAGRYGLLADMQYAVGLVDIYDGPEYRDRTHGLRLTVAATTTFGRSAR